MARVSWRTCALRVERGRLYVSWDCVFFSEWLHLLSDFRAVFPRHQDASYCQGAREWSLPGHHKARLDAWAEHWFEPDCIQGSLDASAQADDDPLVGLSRERARLVAQLRAVPDRGPIHAALKREIAALNERIGQVMATIMEQDATP